MQSYTLLGITYQSNAADIQDLYIQNKTPIATNMYNKEMTKKVAALYLQDILLYASRVKDGITELEYWINRSF